MLALLLITFLVLMVLNVPMAFCLLTSSTVYLLCQDHYPLSLIVNRLVDAADSYPLLAIPLFILAANIMNHGAITTRLTRFGRSLVGHIPGGLGHVNVVASIFFAGMSGSAVADAAGLGKIEIEAMNREGYDPEFSAAITAASSSIGPIIPPSIPFVIYGAVAEVSVGSLFIAGIIPGLMMGVALMLMVYYIAKKRGYPSYPRETLPQIVRSFGEAFPALMTPLLIVGGMLSGIFSPTEAAMVAVFYALIIGLLTSRTFNLRDYFNLTLDAVEGTAVIMLIVVASVLFGTVLAHENVSIHIMKLLAPFAHSTWMTMLAINIFLLIIGCVVEPIISLLIFLPMLLPAAISVGIHPVQFGVVAVLNLMIGLLTPPVGMVLYIVTDISQLPFEKVARATLVFVWPLIAVLLLISFIPELTMFLPRLFM
jgi:tripartite ATP-independent transporter DctM subunit